MGRDRYEAGWERGSKHGWRAIHRIRRDKKGAIVEETYLERTFLASLVALPALTAFLWWAQARLDGGQQLVVVVAAVLSSIYSAYLIVAVVLVDAAGRLLKRLID